MSATKNRYSTLLVVAWLAVVPAAWLMAESEVGKRGGECVSEHVIVSNSEISPVSAVRTGSAAGCQVSLDDSVKSDIVAVTFNEATASTHVYFGDYVNDRIGRSDITSDLTVLTTPIQTPYGLPWIASDLDGDGYVELVVQRGDPGFDGNGYLDIVSAPNWQLRNRFVFPGMKVYMHATAVDVDADPNVEVFLTPSSFDSSRAVTIDFDTLLDEFRIVSSIPAPILTTGQAAVADFDEDGRIEFIVGNATGYGLFEFTSGALSFVGPIGGSGGWNNTHAVAADAMPGDTVFALLGHSSGDGIGYWYDLLRPIGDNLFEQAQSFQRTTGALGVDPCFAADIDCDGLDELLLGFYPEVVKLEWNEDSASFVESCNWSQESLGTFLRFHRVDIDQNGIAEVGVVNHLNDLRTISDSCTQCDGTLQCPTPGPWCYCPCIADAHCDSISNILDVLQTINAAFRGASETLDPMCPISRSDVDNSGTTDVIDVTKVINVTFRGSTPQSQYYDPCP